MQGLASLCHEVGRVETMEGVTINMRAPYLYPTRPKQEDNSG